MSFIPPLHAVRNPDKTNSTLLTGILTNPILTISFHPIGQRYKTTTNHPPISMPQSQIMYALTVSFIVVSNTNEPFREFKISRLSMVMSANRECTASI